MYSPLIWWCWSLVQEIEAQLIIPIRQRKINGKEVEKDLLLEIQVTDKMKTTKSRENIANRNKLNIQKVFHKYY